MIDPDLAIVATLLDRAQFAIAHAMRQWPNDKDGKDEAEIALANVLIARGHIDPNVP